MGLLMGHSDRFELMGHSDRFDVALVISCDQVRARLGLARVDCHTCQSGSLSRVFEERNTTCSISDVNCRSVKNSMYFDDY